MNIAGKIMNYALEEIMGERFGRYSKYIIQDRAIPDVRDGLKPVQRRILYAMYIGKNTYDKPYRKSAKTVGDVIGSFHPHGDSSIYDAMVRMSQDWKMNIPYIDMHGNNGSIDGDSAAAYRYTEAKLSKISNELLKDIDKNTVKFAPNFDDSVMEPTVLPAKFPNLLVNGTTGISAGYATNIPPHNLGEIIDATIKLINNPNTTYDEIKHIVKGPDFPTGGLILDSNGIDDAFMSGRGKVIVRARTNIENVKGKKAIVVSEIPFDVLKCNIVKKIDEIRIDKRIDGILEVRDETDKEGLRISIDIKKEANEEVILNYLLKNTELQVSYNYNMVAIVNRRPKLLSLIDALNSYVMHLKEVILHRTTFDLETAKARLHIVEGLVKAISILDELIKTIRASKNKQDAINNLVSMYEFSIKQADAIVTLQLYRLTNTDITILEQEYQNLLYIIECLTKILNDGNELNRKMVEELTNIKNEYNKPRKTTITDNTSDIKINTEMIIPKEEVVVIATNEGYVKRTSKRSYDKDEMPLLKENDYILYNGFLNTTDIVLMFTNLGNYLYVPVYDIPDIKWKVMGKHISNIVKLNEDESIISVIPVKSFSDDRNIVISSKNGMIKKSKLSDFKVTRYSKPINCMNLREDDKVISAFVCDYDNVMICTKSGYCLWFDQNEIPISMVKSTGVKSIILKNDVVVSTVNFDDTMEYVTVFTDKNTAKRIKMSEFEKSVRARRGLVVIKEVKSNPYSVINLFVNTNKAYYGLLKQSLIEKIKATEISISDRYKTGSTISNTDVLGVFEVKNMEVNKDIEVFEEEKIVHQISLEDIDEKLKKIDEILE